MEMFTPSGVWIHGIAEDALDVQNPTNPEKIRLLATRIRLSPGHRVLDVGSGRGGPALIFASEFGARVTCLEWYPGFVEGARARAEAAGVSDLVEVVHGDGSKYPIEPGRYDVVACIGATFVFGGFEGTMDVLTPAAEPGGHVVVGEVYEDEGEPTLASLMERFEDRGLEVSTVIRASGDDWDRYVSGRAAGLLDWLDANPDHPDVEEVRAHRRREAREFVEPSHSRRWAIIAGRRGKK